MKSILKEKILRSGIIFTAISFLSGVGNLVFQIIIGRRLDKAEFGLVNATSPFMALLGLPVQIANTAVVHHIAHFRGTNNEARLQGLLAGCRSFLFKLTVVGCAAAALLIQPLSVYFNIPRLSLTLVALVSLIVGLWGAYATALCQGMGWFKRLAIIGFIGVLVKLAFVWLVTRHRPIAEVGVLAIGVGTMANLAVFLWWRDLFKPGERISPWDRDFFRYLTVAAAAVTAQTFFTQGDMLVAKKYFPADEVGAYAAAARIGSALHLAVSPLLIVLFTARSTERTARAATGPIALLTLYAVGLLVAGTVAYFARDLCVRVIFGSESPAASAMVPPLVVTMIFVGLIQALGMWALASHWLKVGVLYGALGIAYWTTLLNAGTTSERLLKLMPIAAASAFLVMLTVWLISVRRPGAPAMDELKR